MSLTTVAPARLKLLFILLFIILPVRYGFSQYYFQQEVNFSIQVALDDTNHLLNAFETIEYINNSPDTLYFLYFHLWPNGYADNNTPLAKQLFRLNGKSKLFDTPELNGYIDSLDFAVDEKQVQWSLLADQPDICKITLNKPLIAGDTIYITTPFRVKIPKGVTSRLGHIEQSYQISQWYPKPAVYDRNGWHPISYLDQGEFFSEFGDFDVSITLPDNYTVGASGNLQNLLEIGRLNAMAADSSWMNTVTIMEDDYPASSTEMKTLRYIAKGVHDFAWFADKRFYVQKGAVKLPNSDREVITWVMFTKMQADLWRDALEYVNDGILYFSEKVGDYPYHNYTVVQSALSAGYGMEYPGIAVIGSVDDSYSLNEVIAHEIGHNWFYSALGFDERRYPFLDEGITSAYTARYMKERYPDKKLWEVWFKNRELAAFLKIDRLPVQRMEELEWLVQARNNNEQPMNLSSTDYSDQNYGTIIYNKSSFAFNYLRAYLGDSIFDLSMQGFYRKWIYKHPEPNDLQVEFETQSGENLDWFFSDLAGTTKRMDYKMVRLKNNQLLIKNRGEMTSPLVISGSTKESLFFETWIDGFVGKEWIELPEGDYDEIKIDPQHVTPELNRLNNNIKTSGIFKKGDPIQSQILFSVEDPEKISLMYIPAVNWTRENGFMAGMAIHNGFIIPKPVEYIIMPFYAFGNNDLAGMGRVAFNILPYDNIIRKATISVEGTQYGAPGNQNYHKMETGLKLYLRNREMNSPLNQSVAVKYIAASNLYQIELDEKADRSSIWQFGYFLENQRLINPFSLQAELETGKAYQKTSLEFNYRVSYYGGGRGLDIRLFAGAMLSNGSGISFYGLSAAGRNGRDQYLYRGSYPDRFASFPDNFWSRQMTLSEGALVSPINDTLGFSRWLFSLSLTADMPKQLTGLPIKPFVNVLLNETGLPGENGSPFFFEAGLKAGIWDIFEIYIPMVVSKNIDSVSGPFKSRVRFIFTLDSFNKVKVATSN